jgi:hypothetical protein
VERNGDSRNRRRQPPVAHLCDATWIVTSESDGAIAGTYTISGGNGFDVTCTGSSSGGSGGWQGTITSNSTINIPFDKAPSGCRNTVNPPLTGTVLGTSMSLAQTNHQICGGFAVDQIITISMTRR